MKPDRNAYRRAVAVALVPAFVIGWMALGVGILGPPGDPADLMYVGVLAIGAVGVLIARFRPGGMARALSATAVAQALVALIVLVTGIQQGPSAGTLLILHGVFVALFAGAAWLFREAARQRAG